MANGEEQYEGIVEATHEELLAVYKKLTGDFEPWGRRLRETEEDWFPDCSCGCRFLHCLEGSRGMDWGVCFNPKSPRSGLLTFEHMGCDQYDPTEDEDEDEEKKAKDIETEGQEDESNS